MQVNNYVPVYGGTLDPNVVLGEVRKAEATWNTASSKVLFNTAGSFISDAPSVTMDSKNSIAFRPISGNALAMTTTWYSYTQTPDGQYTALESDMIVNSGLSWSTSATPLSYFGAIGPFDVQAVVLHELGHTLGLGDLYTLSDWRMYDREEVMNLYNDPQRILGLGDANGIWQLYH